MRVLEGEMEMEMESEIVRVRLRLVFENHHILSKSQRKEGLAKSWFLFKPKLHKTISDLSAYLLHIFHLHHSCPHGLLLSMDGFVLPPFESTCVLKDKDVVCVRKKVGVSAEIDDLHNGLEIVKLLANEEFDKETGGYESELEEDEHEESLEALDLEATPVVDKVSKKRKASNSKKLQGSKRKRSKLSSAKEIIDLENVENDGHVVKSGSSHRVHKKNRIKKDKSSDVQGKPEKSSSPEIDETTNCIMRKAKRSCELQENEKGSADVSSMPVRTEKLPSRSARRKKAKRRWLREQAKIEKLELQQKQVLPKDNQQSLDRDDKKHEHQQPNETSRDKDSEKLSKDQQPDSSSGADDDFVPVVIRPGHIRFEVPGKGDAGQAVQQNHTPVETFQWNGITSKKKGQKWGTEKASFSKKNYENYSQDYSAMLTTEEEIPVNNCKDLDFDNLRPYTTLPKVGDVIAYRLIELSSCWTPEPTSFRVGKISWYDSESNRVRLVPVPDYPLDIEKKIDDDESAQQPDISSYGEDGSLQIDFSLLIDVRIVMHGNLNNAKSVTAGVDEVSVENQDATTKLRDSNNNEGAHTPAQENGKVNAWEEINQVLSAKKAELSQVDDQSTKENSGRSRLSYKRSSAVGPTMAFLRSQNEF
ncbi:hypothetical protein Ddye_031398 [Dipteronia dyeriana]|uniref:Coilin n=1 Tax=Dipteronia dyeriana TaxID=168575 RepID=A0AAD9TIV8_9ROSI|nr:hypothetical protein Ddye_031398 [Dipteronia dyeriana]